MTASDTRLRDIEALARLLDDRFRVPGTSIRFGLDGLIGLVPGLGDVATTLVSLYVVARARDLGAPGGVLAMMLGNILLDTAVGAIPVLGDAFDIAFKANRRNLGLLKRTLERRATGPHTTGAARGRG
ncbi:DUF4112 domain-containing protein [Thalassobaculum sp.]|uniref:DUF4112 domain-containing protein n=1 Tax=Thalassobaculum sp. TaxID=2022740 RepID=UPI0032ECA142